MMGQTFFSWVACVTWPDVWDGDGPSWDDVRMPFKFTTSPYTMGTVPPGVDLNLRVCGDEERVNLSFETLFETGVDEMSWDDTENYRMGGGYKWPSVDDVVEYRRNVRNIILKLIADTTLVLPITMDTPWWALMMGMEHERIHLETSSVLLRQLPLHLVQKPPGWVYAPSSSGT
ncbi:hypothetical protein C0Q70_15895 [Pomacea canaliculata]|uniref:Uncharacterized protein n=1 Tax=Pomacea canaliculata TaxID=400727 RepID=A0A2T7NN94_POMCA|nr:hypothetical protein C0Q70_15895 [Pomacea canaliculata]